MVRAAGQYSFKRQTHKEYENMTWRQASSLNIDLKRLTAAKPLLRTLERHKHELSGDGASAARLRVGNLGAKCAF